MRVKKNRDTLEQSYLLFKLINPELKISKAIYKKICYRMNELIASYILETGLEYILPYKLGSLQIRKRKMKFHKLKMDYQEWKNTGIISYHLNEHSNEYYAYCHWKRYNVKLKNKKSYCFNLSRDNKRALAQEMKTNHHKYIVDVKRAK